MNAFAPVDNIEPYSHYHHRHPYGWRRKRFYYGPRFYDEGPMLMMVFFMFILLIVFAMSKA